MHDFVDRHQMSLLERLLKRNKNHFEYQSQNCFNLEELQQGALFRGIDSKDVKAHYIDKCDRVVDGRSCFDRALEVLVSQPTKYNNTASLQLRESVEAYVYIRNKLLMYASEVFNKTIVSSVQGDEVFFYYFIPNTPLATKLNGHGYILRPHVDYYPLSGIYDRPLSYVNGFKLTNPARRYSSTMYFDDIPQKDGGQFEWYDFPNNKKLPPAIGRMLPSEEGLHKNISVTLQYSPSFADPDLNITSIQPRKGTLLLFSAQDDIHGVREYSGSKERWGFMMALSDKETMDAFARNEIPPDLVTKTGPIL